MESMYAEAGCKIVNTAKSVALRILVVLAVIVTFVFATLLANRILFALGIVLGCVVVWMWPRFNMEWEYIFVDGQLDFDTISGGEKRKTRLRIDFDDVEVIAPLTSHSLDSYRNNKIYNYSSLKKDARIYVVVVRLNEQGLCQIYFEPSDKMLDIMKLKAPRKVMGL